MDQSDIPGRNDDVPLPDEITVVEPGHPLYGRRFRLCTITNAMRTDGYAFVEYRPGILLKLSITVTSLRLSPELRPAATKLSVEGLRELVALAGDPDTLTDEDRRFVQALQERSPSIATVADLVTRFCGMVKDKAPDPFDDWLREAEASALAPFAAGIRRDEDAVRAALSEPWSSGQVEGQVNRLKAIKRTMYGRTGFDLLRGRVPGHA